MPETANPNQLTFNRRQLADATGATQRQIQTWTEDGIIKPGPNGLFGADDCIIVRWILRLRAGGATLYTARATLVDPGARRIIACAKRRTWAAHVWDGGPHVLIFPKIEDLVHWLKGYLYPAMAIDLFELGPRPAVEDATPLEQLPEFSVDGPKFGIVRLVGMRQAPLMDVSPMRGRDE